MGTLIGFLILSQAGVPETPTPTLELASKPWSPTLLAAAVNAELLNRGISAELGRQLYIEKLGSPGWLVTWLPDQAAPRYRIFDTLEEDFDSAVATVVAAVVLLVVEAPAAAAPAYPELEPSTRVEGEVSGGSSAEVVTADSLPRFTAGQRKTALLLAGFLGFGAGQAYLETGGEIWFATIETVAVAAFGVGIGLFFTNLDEGTRWGLLLGGGGLSIAAHAWQFIDVMFDLSAHSAVGSTAGVRLMPSVVPVRVVDTRATGLVFVLNGSY